MKTLNQITAGDKFHSIEYLKINEEVQDVYRNLKVTNVTDKNILAVDENNNYKTFNKDNIINYALAKRIVIVEAQGKNDVIPKIFPNYELANETDTHILLVKEINGKTIHRLLAKEEINEMQEMN